MNLRPDWSPAWGLCPQHTCPVCGEFLPHYCAPAVTITRQRYTGKRLVVITDRMPTSQEGAA